jgi:adenosylcobinamide-GDP ribazoletransferase
VSGAVRSFLVALHFLTIFPYPRGSMVEGEDLGRSMAHFSSVGALLGGILWLADNLLRPYLPLDLINILLLALLTVLSGGLHWDGLADTLDGLGAGGGRHEMLAAMRDSRLGTFAVLGLILLILFDLSLLHHLGERRGTYLFLSPLLSRLSLVVLALTQPYAGAEGGVAKEFVERVGGRELALAGGIALLACLILLGLRGLLLLVVVGAFTLLVGGYLRRRLGGITGDSLGAHNELVGALVWLFGCLC